MNFDNWLYNVFNSQFCYGKSMLPTLAKFSFVTIKKTDSYKIGDIILLKTHDKKYHMHKITEITARFVSTKGDNLQQQSYEIDVPTQNIKGKLVWNWPNKDKK